MPLSSWGRLPALVSPRLPDFTSREDSSVLADVSKDSQVPWALSLEILCPTKTRIKAGLLWCVSKVPATSHAKSSEAICLITLPWIYTRIDVICPRIETQWNSPHPHLLKIWTAFVNCSLLETTLLSTVPLGLLTLMCDPIWLFLQCPRIRCAEQETSAHSAAVSSVCPHPVLATNLPFNLFIVCGFLIRKVIHGRLWNILKNPF